MHKFGHIENFLRLVKKEVCRSNPIEKGSLPPLRFVALPFLWVAAFGSTKKGETNVPAGRRQAFSLRCNTIFLARSRTSGKPSAKERYGGARLRSDRIQLAREEMCMSLFPNE